MFILFLLVCGSIFRSECCFTILILQSGVDAGSFCSVLDSSRPSLAALKSLAYGYEDFPHPGMETAVFLVSDKRPV